MNKDNNYVGLDVHKATIQVALFPANGGRPLEWSLVNEGKAIAGMVRKLRRHCRGTVTVCYEAGPTGYGLARKLNALEGFSCMVIAPSLIPRKPGDRIKTDRRDARKLGEMLRAGLLTEVKPPSPEDEALRDLCRAREDSKEDQTRARHRMSKFLLRRDLRFDGGKKNWTQMHHAWLRRLRLKDPFAQATFDAYLLALTQSTERLKQLDEAIETAATTTHLAEPVAYLRCFRGIDTISAMTIATELHSFERFQSPTGLMAFLGLTPSEYSSGGSRRLGGITKTGNGHVRRILVEAAWHQRHRPQVGRALAARRRGQPGWVIDIANAAQVRLHRKYWRMVNQKKHVNKATVAVARELTGFIWAVLAEHAIHRTEAQTA